MAWQIDPYHLQVEFSAKHLGMMTVRGHFTEASASGTILPDNPSASSIEVTIPVASVRTNNAQRDNDLRSANFLDAEHYPTITFKSTSIKPTDQDRYEITGDLTVKDVTKPLTLNAMRYGEFNDPGMMGHRMAYTAEGEINRKEYGLTFNMMLDGRWMVSDEVKINIELELVEKKEEAAAGAASA
jgi:polyisoprenoid-binding protein YceI